MGTIGNTNAIIAAGMKKASSTDQNQELAHGGSTDAAFSGRGLDLTIITITRSESNSRLVALPCELLIAMASYLSTVDFNSLRTACRHLESKIFPYWANRFFKKKRFMISEFSLQALSAISRHETLSKHLKHLIIGLDEFKAIILKDAITQEDFQQYQAAICSQERLLDTDTAVNILAESLANFPNLEKIDICDFNSPIRDQDPQSAWGMMAEWRSYGSSEVRKWQSNSSHDNNLLPHFGTLVDHAFAARVFKAVLRAAGKSCSCSVQSLEILLRNSCSAFSDTAFALAPELTGRLSDVLYSLTRLHLHLRLDKDPSTINFRRFLASTPNITWLRLNFVHNCLPSELLLESRFLEWLVLEPDQISDNKDSSGWSDANPAPVAMPLQQLAIDNIQWLEVLTSISRKFSNLEQLDLEFTSMPSMDTFSNNFKKLQSSAPKTRRLVCKALISAIVVEMRYPYKWTA